MVRVKVKFLGFIRDVTGSTLIETELEDDATALDLLTHLREKFGQDFYDRVMDEDTGIRTYVQLFLNNEEVDRSELKTKKLVVAGSGADALLMVMPASMGG